MWYAVLVQWYCISCEWCWEPCITRDMVADETDTAIGADGGVVVAASSSSKVTAGCGSTRRSRSRTLQWSFSSRTALVPGWTSSSPAKLRRPCRVIFAVLCEGKRGEENAVDELGRLERKVEEGRSWNLQFKFEAAILRRDRKSNFRWSRVAIFGKTERGRWGSLYGGVFVA
jgi:hypothetical protein